MAKANPKLSIAEQTPADELIMQIARVAEALEYICEHLDSIIEGNQTGRHFIRTLDIGRD